MPSPSTPPNSQDASSGSALSKTAPLKRDIHGSQTHSSTPYQRASLRYKEMAWDACDKFVGPMPVNEFLSDFIPETTLKRPASEITFTYKSVSETEDVYIRLERPV